MSIWTAFAGQLPLTVKEIGLMLRTGYSSAAILKELAVRHFADTLDPANQSLLVKAGASDDLIQALQNGSYSLSAEQTSAVQQQLAEQTKRREVEAERLQKLDARYRDRLVQERQARVAPPPNAGANPISAALKGDLVSWQNGSPVHFDDAKLENKKLIALYFSAHWCGPCRKFTPELVDYYNRIAPQHPEFELIFVSSDKSQFAMDTYMREAGMPWPAIDFQKVAGKAEITRYAGPGIPCLVLIDSTGKVISNSYAGTEYLGPKKVLADLDAIFASGNLAQAH